MATKKIAISMQSEVLEEIDTVADEWFTSRSAAIVRIYQEWKRAREIKSQAEAKALAEAV